MCITVSLAKKYSRWREFVSVPIILETLEYRSDTREVVVSLDCVVRNLSETPVDIWLTHVDNVEGRLATDDWFSLGGPDPDFRAKMISDIHDGCWDFEPDAGRLRYRDPIEVGPSGYETSGFALSAQPLSYGPDIARKNPKWLAYSDFIDNSAEPFVVSNRSAYRLRANPVHTVGQAANSCHLPYTSFGIGPIGPTGDCEAVFFRLTVLIANESYTRLVQPSVGRKFYVYSGNRVCEEIEDFGLERLRRGQHYAAFREFFDAEIIGTRIDPDKYQIIICQPEVSMPSRECVAVKPTSTRISQRTIADRQLRNRAMWFSACSNDFSMSLEYVSDSSVPLRIVEHVRSAG